LYTLCVGIAYLILAGDLLPGVVTKFNAVGLISERWFLMSIVACIAAFAAAVPNISALRYSSFVSLICIHLLVLFVVINFFIDRPALPNVPPLFAFKPQTFVALSILSVAYFVHYCILPIQQELYNPIMRRMNKVMFRTETLITALYVIIGVFGVLSFPGDVNGNVLKGYSNGNTLMTVSRIFLSVTLAVGLPLLIFPLRTSIERRLFGHSPYSFRKSFPISGALCLVSCVVAIGIPNVVAVWSFVGAVLCNFTAYVVPAAVYLKLHRTDDEEQDAKNFELKKAYALMIFGFIIMVICTAVSIWNVLQ
jgi:amino acid permease